MNTKRRNQLESWFSLLPLGIVVITTIMTKKMVITFQFFPFITDDPPIQSVSFTSSENKCVKQRRINTVDCILVVMAGFLREVQSTIDRAALTHVSF